MCKHKLQFKVNQLYYYHFCLQPIWREEQSFIKSLTFPALFMFTKFSSSRVE